MVGKKGKYKGSRKVGRDASTGRFIPVKEAERRKKTATVETIKFEIRGGRMTHKPPTKKK